MDNGVLPVTYNNDIIHILKKHLNLNRRKHDHDHAKAKYNYKLIAISLSFSVKQLTAPEHASQKASLLLSRPSLGLRLQTYSN